VTGPGPFDNPVGLNYLGEISAFGPSESEALALLDANEPNDLELSQEQYVLATVISELAFPHNAPPAATAVARYLAGADVPSLQRAAWACMDRLVKNPFAALWRGHHDGGVQIRRQARALRGRLHRAIEPDAA